MSEAKIEEIVPILVTPSDADGAIDADSLERLVEHNVSAGVHGLGIAIGSEMFKLSEEERGRLTGLVARFIAGRIPFVVNASAAGTDLAIHCARMAASAGADALMVMPPAFFPPRADDVPIILQDVVQAPISPGLARAAEKAQGLLKEAD